MLDFCLEWTTCCWLSLHDLHNMNFAEQSFSFSVQDKILMYLVEPTLVKVITYVSLLSHF